MRAVLVLFCLREVCVCVCVFFLFACGVYGAVLFYLSTVCVAFFLFEHEVCMQFCFICARCVRTVFFLFERGACVQFCFVCARYVCAFFLCVCGVCGALLFYLSTVCVCVVFF